MLPISQNPLLFGSPGEVQAVDADALTSPAILTRPKRTAKREVMDLKRKQTATEAVEGLTRENELYGFTKGQFSMLDLLSACLGKTGPAFLTLSTWTAARKESLELEAMLRDGRLLGSRWLIDRSFVRRHPDVAHHVREVFGADAIRISNTHCKFALFANADWKLVLRTSMNLNMNPRSEDFTLSNDPELFAFISTIMDEIWARKAGSLKHDSQWGVANQ